MPNHPAGPEETPAANVAAHGSDIKITALKTFPAGPKCFVRIDTNKSVSGWGEVTGSEPKVSAVLAESLFGLLDQENPSRIEYPWQKLYRAHRAIRRGAGINHCTPPADLAL